MSNSRITVRILTNGTIPIYGRPGVRPITMPMSDYELLKKNGIQMKVIEESNSPFVESSPKKEERKEVVEKKKVEEKVKKEKAQEKVDQEAERVTINSENFDADSFYTADFLTKKSCLSILAAREISPKSNKATILKEQVIKSNPKLPAWQEDELREMSEDSSDEESEDSDE